MLRLALAAAALAWPSAAHADPISIAILGAIGVEAVAGTTIVAVTTFALTAAVGVGLNYLANKLMPKPADTGTPDAPATVSGVQTSVSIGGDIPRGSIFGDFATAGQLAYFNTFGDSNENLELVYIIGDGLHDGLAGMYVDGVAVSFGGDPAVTAADIPEKNGTMSVMFYRGSEAQAADFGLVANANPAGRWTTNHRLAGMAYVVVRIVYNTDIYQGIPQFLFVVRGLRCYDLRKDSTNGGSGTHRWGTESTYEFSSNPAICLYNYQRGIWRNGELIIGQGLAPFDLINDLYVSAANACDETVTTKLGDTVPRYIVGLYTMATSQHRDTLEAFLTAMAGILPEHTGAFGPIAGVAQIPVLTFTDDDILTGHPVTYSAKRSRAELINAIFGTYTEPGQNWASVSFAPRTSSADESNDGERLSVQRDYPMICSQEQVQRVGEIERRLGRLQATMSLTLGFKFSVLEPGDWVVWNSARYGTKTYQLTNTSVAADESVTIAGREIDATAFDFAPDIDELDPLVPGDLPGIGSRATTVGGFTLTPTQITGVGTLVIPALTAQWVPIDDQTVMAVVIEYRPQVQPAAVKQVRCDHPGDGAYVISEGIQASTIYEARATIVTEPPRPTTWTSWITQTAPPLHVVPMALNLDATVGLGNLVTSYFKDQARRLDNIEQFITTAAADALAQTISDVQENRRNIVSQTGAVQASVTTLATAVSNDETAFASYQTTTTASINGLNTSVTTNSTSIATINGKLASQWSVTLDTNGYVSGVKAFNDGSTAGFTVITDVFQVAKPSVTGGSPIPVFTIGTVTVGGVPTSKIAFRGDMILDGTVTARMLTVGAINAGNIIADNVIVTSHLVANAVTFGTFVQGASANIGLGNVTIASMSFSTSGGLVSLDFGFYMSWTSGIFSTTTTGITASIPVQMQIDGSIFQSDAINSSCYYVTSGPGYAITLNQYYFSDMVVSLGAGSHSATLVIPPITGPAGTNIFIAHPAIRAFEYKR